jgi:hypothetical protein
MRNAGVDRVTEGELFLEAVIVTIEKTGCPLYVVMKMLLKHAGKTSLPLTIQTNRRIRNDFRLEQLKYEKSPERYKRGLRSQMTKIEAAQAGR